MRVGGGGAAAVVAALVVAVLRWLSDRYLLSAIFTPSSTKLDSSEINTYIEFNEIYG